MDDAETRSHLPVVSRLDVEQARDFQEFTARTIEAQKASGRMAEQSRETIERTWRLIAQTRRLLDKKQSHH